MKERQIFVMHNLLKLNLVKGTVFMQKCEVMHFLVQRQEGIRFLEFQEFRMGN